MYLFILSALAAIILCLIGMAMLVRELVGGADRRILRPSYWFAAAAATVLMGAVFLFEM
jgi:hypothetical protein